MHDLARHAFDLGTAINRALGESIARGDSRIVVHCTEISPAGVRLAAEPHIYPRCHADVFTEGTLTITADDSSATVREYSAGEWLEAVAYGPDGHISYALKPGARR